jgi:two-component system cell cycle response regulator
VQVGGDNRVGFFGGKAFRAGLSFLGEFTDRKLEKEYAYYEVKYSIKFVRPTVLLLGSLYFLFIIADFSLIGNGRVFNAILINRVLFLMISILFSFWLKRNLQPGSYYVSVTAYEITGAAFLLSALYRYETPVFLIQSLHILLLLLIIYILPNRWLYTVMVMSATSFSFYVLSFTADMVVSSREFFASVVHTVLVLLLFALSSYRLNRYKRIQYTNSKELAKLSSRDALTGIYNRYRFEEELHRAIVSANRYGTELSLIMFDIDNFKAINDSYGHLVGDKVLVDFTRIVDAEIRECDFFSRWGGEEFVLILPGTNKEDAERLANRLRDRICSTYFNPIGRITCSFGIDSLSAGDDSKSLFQRVDRLMYLAKEMGKDQVISMLK